MDKKKILIVFGIMYMISLGGVLLVQNHNAQIAEDKATQLQIQRDNESQIYQGMYDNGLYMYKQGSYEAAKQEVASIPVLWEHYDKVEKLVSDCNDKLISELRTKAKKYVSDNDYMSALSLLRDSEFASELSVRSDYEKYAGDYVEIVLNDAEQAYRADEVNGVKEAVRIIEDALMIVSDSRLTDAQTKYADLLPVSLFTKNVFWGDLNEWAPIYNDVIDIDGNNRGTCRRLRHTEDYTFLPNYKITFSLNGEYKKITGTIFLPQGGLDSNRSASNWLVFYDDKDNVIEISQYCNKDNTNVSFSVDVSGVNHLTVLCSRDTFLSSGTTYIDGDFNLYK